MNILDIFKKKKNTSIKRGLMLKSMRGYDAAKSTEATYTWTNTPQTNDDLIRTSLTTLRTRSREEIRNNDYAKRFISLVKTNVIGHKGLSLQSRARVGSGKLDRNANEAIETAWRDWSKPWNASLNGRLSLNEIQRICIATIAGDGEILIRKHFTGKYNFRLETIDASWLDENYNDELRNGRYIRLGIEYNSQGVALAYHLSDPIHRKNMYMGYQNRHEYVRVPASQIYHLFLPEWVSQKRGLPWMSASLLRMHHLKGYENAALVNARVGASKMGFFTSGDGSGYTGQDKTDDGEIISEADPGMFEQLPDGVSFTKFDPDYPAGEFGNFVKASLRGIASGLGVSYNKLANDLEGVSFSSLRGGEIDERETWKLLQEWFIESFMERLYLDWLDVVILSPRIPFKHGHLSPERVDKYRFVTFQGKRWAWVDPLKDMQAAQLAIAQRIRSRSDVIREMTGREPEDVWKEISREDELLEELGITVVEEGQMTEEKEDEENKDD